MVRLGSAARSLRKESLGIGVVDTNTLVTARSNGHLIGPAEIGGLLERRPSVRLAAVVPYKTSDGDTEYGERLRDWGNDRLRHEVDLAAVQVFDELPRSINGRIQRAHLARAYQT